MKKNARRLILGTMLTIVMVLPSQQAHAGIFGLIKAILVKAIKAADLKVQQMQNRTLDLQNAQKSLQNQMSRNKLDEISNWTKRQQQQYQQYFDELKKVKTVIRDYQRIRDILRLQWKITNEYQRVWQIVQKDKNFSTEELRYMERVYGGILRITLENVRQLKTITTSYTTEMGDAKRMEIANNIAEDVQRNYDDLCRFNNENILLSLSRTKSQQDAQKVKALYGIR